MTELEKISAMPRPPRARGRVLQFFSVIFSQNNRNDIGGDPVALNIDSASSHNALRLQIMDRNQLIAPFPTTFLLLVEMLAVNHESNNSKLHGIGDQTIELLGQLF